MDLINSAMTMQGHLGEMMVPERTMKASPMHLSCHTPAPAQHRFRQPALLKELLLRTWTGQWPVMGKDGFVGSLINRIIVCLG